MGICRASEDMIIITASTSPQSSSLCHLLWPTSQRSLIRKIVRRTPNLAHHPLQVLALAEGAVAASATSYPP